MATKLTQTLSSQSAVTVLSTLVVIFLFFAVQAHSAPKQKNNVLYAQSVSSQPIDADSRADEIYDRTPLQEDNAALPANNLRADIPGVGAFFGSMLDSLITTTADTESNFEKLVTGFPMIFPDLYKVFITL